MFPQQRVSGLTLNLPANWSSIITVALAAILAPATALAAQFPERPVMLLVGSTPGGSLDSLARLIGDGLAKKWGQPVVIRNIAGAEGAIAAETTANATPDGHTLLFSSSNLNITSNQRKLSYDPLTSFAPITLVALQPSVLVVNPSVPVKSLKELIALAKSKPGELNFGSGGEGTTSYLGMRHLMDRTGINMVNVNYKGGAPMTSALLGNEVQVLLSSVTGAAPHITAGKARALAITSAVRFETMPDVPTVEEAAGLKGFKEEVWDGVLAPARISRDVVNKLYADIAAVTRSPAVVAALPKQGFSPVANTPKEFAAYLKEDFAMWAARLKPAAAK